MTGGGRAWRACPAGLRLLVRVTPKASQDCVDGLLEAVEGPALKVRVRAVADKGEANRAVERVVAQWLGLARTSVRLAQGGRSRLKTLDIGGAPAELEALLAARLRELKNA